MLFDGEEEPAGCTPFLECGLRGSTAYAMRHVGEVKALVLLDYIAEKRGLRFPREGGSDVALWEQLRARRARSASGRCFPLRPPARSSTTTRRSPQRGVRAIDVIDFDYPQRDSLADRSTSSRSAAWTPSVRPFMRS